MALKEALPCRLSFSIRRGIDAMSLQNVADAFIRDQIAKITQCALYTIVTPTQIFASHAKHEFDNFSRDGEPSDFLAAAAVILICGYQFPMPSQNRIWGYDSGHLLEHYPPEYLAFHGQTPTLIIVEQNAFFAELFSEHIIFGAKILNYLLLSMVYPTSQDQEQQLPGF